MKNERELLIKFVNHLNRPDTYLNINYREIDKFLAEKKDDEWVKELEKMPCEHTYPTALNPYPRKCLYCGATENNSKINN